jgi:hypothetical protein
MLWVWVALVPLSLLIQGLLDLLPQDFAGHGLIIPQGIVVTFAGMGTFSYLGLEYTTQIFQNTKQPAGVGEVTNLALYKTMAYIWLSFYLIAVAVSTFVKITPPFPLTELATFAGTVMLAYVAGQKGSKLSVNMGSTGADFSGSGASSGGYGSMGSPSINPVWSSPPPAPTTPPPAPTGPSIPR